MSAFRAGLGLARVQGLQPFALNVAGCIETESGDRGPRTQDLVDVGRGSRGAGTLLMAAPPPQLEGARQSCPGFQPKRTAGPLRSWCALCGHHLAEHATAPGRPAAVNASSAPTEGAVARRGKAAAAAAPAKTLTKSRPKGKGGGKKGGREDPLIAVFDFDRTLTAVHAGPFHLGPNIAETLFGGAQRFRALVGMLQDLHAKGVELHICTFNSGRLVAAALGDLCSLFTSISGSETFRSPKAFFINSHILAGRGSSGLIFVDDDPFNVESVAKAHPDCTVRFVSREDGMDQTDMKFVSSWVKKRAK